MASETIRIIVTSSGTVTVQRQINEIGETAKKSGAAVNTLKNALTTLVTAGAIGTLVHYGDQFNEIQNRLRLVTKGTDDLNNVTQKLNGIANSTYTSLSGVATVYQRVEQSTAKLGITQQQTLDFTQQFSQAVALSGASAQTADQAITQFTQGLGAGVLRGQDLRSVLDGLPGVTNALAAGLNTDIAGLRAMAEQGSLTPKQIIDAFAKVAPNIANDFAKVRPTISQALQVLDNQLTDAAGSISIVFSTAAEVIILFANHLELVTVAVSPLIAALTVLAVKTLSGLVRTAAIEAYTALSGVATALWAATTATWAWTTALLANPIVIGIGIIAGLAAVGATIGVLIEYFIRGKAAWTDFVASLSKGWDNIVYYFNKAKEAIFGKSATEGPGLPNGGKGIGDLPTGSSALGGSKSSSNPNLTQAQVDANVASSVSAATSAATQQLNAGITGGFSTSIDLLNSAQQNSFQSGADTVSNALDTSFTNGAASLGNAITSALPASSSSAGTDGPSINGSWSDYLASVDAWMNNWVTTQGYNRTGKTPQGPSNLDNQTPGSGSFHAFADGGSFRVGGSGGTDSQTVSFRASPNERVTITTPEQQMKMSGANGNTPVNVEAPVINNILDAKNIPLAMDTAKGKTTLVNMIKFNQEEFRRALGVN